MKNLSLFADSCANISMSEGVVRFDLVTLTPMEGDSKKAQISQVASIATSLQGFIRMNEQMNQVMAKLLEQGVISKAPRPDTAQDAKE